jgi:hypothetical protein
MNRWRVGEDRGSKETGGCPLTVSHRGRRRSGSGWSWSEVREWRGELVSIIIGGEGARSGVVVVVGGGK